MRHFRSFRGSRRRSMPRSTVRTSKYIVVQASASEPAGIFSVSMAVGTDNATLGQTTVLDTAIPTGAKIASFEIFMPKINLAATANFLTWTVQRTLSGQALVTPNTAGGNPRRKNILLTGVIGLGDRQNNNAHVKFRVPPKFQRIGDGDVWSITTDNLTAVSTFYYIIYTVVM